MEQKYTPEGLNKRTTLAQEKITAGKSELEEMKNYVEEHLDELSEEARMDYREVLTKKITEAISSGDNKTAGILFEELTKQRDVAYQKYFGDKKEEEKREKSPESLELKKEIFSFLDEQKQEGKKVPFLLLRAMRGIDTPEANIIREKFKDIDPGLVADSLSGVSSSESYKLRNELFSKHKEDWMIATNIARSLAGLDTPEAWEMRNEFKKYENGYGILSIIPDIMNGLRGLDSEKAWELRNEFKNKYSVSVVSSLDGLDTPRAWEMRNELRDFISEIQKSNSREPKNETLKPIVEGLISINYKKEAFPFIKELKERNDKSTFGTIASSLAGLDTPEAWEMRNEFKKEIKYHDGYTNGEMHILWSLKGLDTDEAWKVRDEFKGKDYLTGALVLSLFGLSSSRSYRLRNELKEKEPMIVLRSLKDLDSPEAWELRNELKKEKGADVVIARDIANLNSPEANKMKKDLFDLIKNEQNYESPSGIALNYLLK